VKLLFIGKRFYTGRDALRDGYGRIWQLPRFWAERGVDTKLWLVDYHSTERVRERVGTLEVVSTPIRGFSFLMTWLRARFAAGERYDVVVASGDCYIGLVAYFLAHWTRARFIFDVYDKYDEFGGYYRFGGFDSFSFLLKRANTRLFASRALMETLGNADRDILVPNGVDVQRFLPRDRQESRMAFDLPLDTLMIGYFGGMEPDRGVADLIAALQLLRGEGMNIELLLGGVAPANLDVHAPGVRYLGNVPYERMPVALACCDLLAVPYRRSAFMDAGASNKIAETIVCGRPLVATLTPNLTENFSSQAKQLEGLLANPGDPADLAHMIRLQAERRVLLELPVDMSWEEIAEDVMDKLGLCEHPLSAQRENP
jgi:glycosyltransferase involved in cell wall biosynthesis